jgi:hypothetical protein
MARSKGSRRAGDAAALKNEDLLAQIKSPHPYSRIRRRSKAMTSVAACPAAGTRTFATDRLDRVIHLVNDNQVVLIEIGIIGVPLALVFACSGYDGELYELLRRFLDGQVKPVCIDAMGEPE